MCFLCVSYGKHLTIKKKFVSYVSLIVHRELTDSGERDAEKARRGGHNNQTEQKEAQAHPAAAHVPTTQSKFSI